VNGSKERRDNEIKNEKNEKQEKPNDKDGRTAKTEPEPIILHVKTLHGISPNMI
jgi:hypothetical protein